MSQLEIPPELKYLEGLRYERAMLIYYSPVPLEEVLLGLFYITRLARRRGRGTWGNRTAYDIARELSQVQNKFSGFDNDTAQRILEEWLKASVLRLNERAGSNKVMSIRPLHFMTYRVDLPATWANLRSVPEFITAILHRDPSAESFASDRDEPFALQSPQNLFWKAFGAGIVNDSSFQQATHDKYDDHCELDIESLLAVRVAET